MVSVIVPIYNIEDYLSYCLESIISQTYKDLEIILVDDGSTDGSGKICDVFAKKDNRIRVIHQENGGISYARNRGIREAIGEYILMPDGDDVLHPQMLEAVYSLITSGEYDFAMCFAEKVYEIPNAFHSIIDLSNSSVISQNNCMGDLFYAFMKIRQLPVVWNKLYRYEVIAGIDFIKTSVEDVCFNTKVFLRTNSAILLHQKLYYWVQRSSSITHQAINNWYVDVIKSYMFSLDAIPLDNQLYRFYCLKYMFKKALTTRHWTKGSPYHKYAEEVTDSMWKQSRFEYIFNNYIPFYERFGFLLFYCCPSIYSLYIFVMDLCSKFRERF